jgi:hypothetical protein
MASLRYYYSKSISDFLDQEPEEIVGLLTLASPHKVDNETKGSWLDEISVMKSILPQYSGRGSLFLEYSIPRMGRRVDVILLIDGFVFVLEFKTGTEQINHREAVIQAWDYALDLKNFQEGSIDRFLFPIAVFKRLSAANRREDLIPYEDGVFYPQLTDYVRLSDRISSVLTAFYRPTQSFLFNSDESWANSGYSPTPTIIEAATALYSQHTVRDITRHDGDIEKTIQRISEIINDCEQTKKKAICFITGVPGAGKTLVGLQAAINEFNNGKKAVYLSGNFPLVEVLKEALARDYIKRNKEARKHDNTIAKVTKDEARSKVKAFIQMIHHFEDNYLVGTKIVDGEIVKEPEFFVSHSNKSYVPAENVAIFDEAQRSWTHAEIARFMADKKRIKGFPYSEPKFLISIMDRQPDWGVVICLVGGGQEINKGEAGLKEWIDALSTTFTGWHVYVSSRLTGKEYLNGQVLDMLTHKERIHDEPDLHLSVSMRSYRAEKVSLFVHQLLDLKPQEASDTLKELDKYPIVLTRSLEKAKQWLRDHNRGSERCGLLASAKAERLKAISINVRYQPNFINWFLEDDTDIRSSNRLEDTLTEFKVQGLEIDWAGVIWDIDMPLEEDGQWHHYYLHGGAKWHKINKAINQEYQLNAYRVLLTRARQGMVIVVPEGDSSDSTRKPELYDSTYRYLRSVGIKSID